MKKIVSLFARDPNNPRILTDAFHPDAAWAWAQSMGVQHAWRAVVAPELALRDGITELLADITKSADATRPSKKTALEDEFAIALRKLLEAS